MNGLSGGSLRWPLDRALPSRSRSAAGVARGRVLERGLVGARERQARAATSAPSATRPRPRPRPTRPAGAARRPAPDTASTAISAPWRWATSASSRTSLTTPVEVSEKVVNTTSTSGVLAEHAVQLGGVDLAAPLGLPVDGLGRRRRRTARPSARRTCRRRRPARARRAARGWRPPTPSRRCRRRRTSAPRWRCRRRSLSRSGRARRPPRTPARGDRASARPSPATPPGGSGVGPGGHQVLLEYGLAIEPAR